MDKFEPVSGSCYVNHAEEAVGKLIVAGGDGAVDLQVAEQAGAIHGSEALFDKLSERGALTTMSRANLDRALNGVGCSPKIAHELVKAGADPHTAGDHGTALTSLRSDERACGGSSDKQIETRPQCCRVRAVSVYHSATWFG